MLYIAVLVQQEANQEQFVNQIINYNKLWIQFYLKPIKKKDGFRKVDYDYVVNSARLAKQNGVKQFHLVSSSGADKNSILLYPKVKGESEDVVSQLQFDKLSIYRPK